MNPLGIPPPGYRLPAATRIGRVQLQVADLARSLEFYQRVLGLELIEHSDERAILGAADRKRVLVELRERPGARPVPRRGLLGLYHYAILLPDRASLGAFLRHLDENEVLAGMSDHFVSEAIYLADPDGLGIEVYADRSPDQWKSLDGQLYMTTKPLDLPDLISAAGSVPWSAAPARTSIGHLHLHVGDIAQATEFYHSGLGFDKTVWSYPGALFLSAGGYHHHLGVNTWAAGAAPAGEEDARLMNWELILPSSSDVASAGESLHAAGYAAVNGSTSVTAADPWGTPLTLRPELDAGP